jgi:hypothetical protein
VFHNTPLKRSPYVRPFLAPFHPPSRQSWVVTYRSLYLGIRTTFGVRIMDETRNYVDLLRMIVHY